MSQAAADDMHVVVAEAAKADEPSFENFVKLMHKKMPPEIIKDIEEWLWEIVFCPGYLYLHSPKQQYACCPPPTDKGSVRPALLCLSRNIKAKYETRMWSENTWVVHIGLPVPAVHFVDQLPAEAKNSIKKVHLKFGHLGDRFGQRGTQPEPEPVPSGLRESHMLGVCFFVGSGSSFNRPDNSWSIISNRIRELPVSYLVVDIRDCHASEIKDDTIDACYRAASSLARWPMERIPEFELLARNELTAPRIGFRSTRFEDIEDEVDMRLWSGRD
ncbi:MAG: hypothetical protein Q9176_005144 [Flavoplaca citrina]